MTIFGHFCKIFSKILGSVTHISIWVPNMIQSFRKIWWVNSKKTAGKKEGHTEGQTLIHRTLLTKARGPKKRHECVQEPSLVQSLWLLLPGFYDRKKSIQVEIYPKSAKNLSWIFLSQWFVTIPRCCKDVYINSFFPHRDRIWNYMIAECFPLTYDLTGFKSRVLSLSFFLNDFPICF